MAGGPQQIRTGGRGPLHPGARKGLVSRLTHGTTREGRSLSSWATGSTSTSPCGWNASTTQR
eukprot:11222032-Lingulodinium_polyedra.AAC.1